MFLFLHYCWATLVHTWSSPHRHPQKFFRPHTPLWPKCFILCVAPKCSEHTSLGPTLHSSCKRMHLACTICIANYKTYIDGGLSNRVKCAQTLGATAPIGVSGYYVIVDLFWRKNYGQNHLYCSHIYFYSPGKSKYKNLVFVSWDLKILLHRYLGITISFPLCFRDYISC